MADDFLLDTGLRMEGFTDQEIARIKTAVPDLMHIAATLQQVMPRINRVAPVLTMFLERINQKVN